MRRRHERPHDGPGLNFEDLARSDEMRSIDAPTSIDGRLFQAGPQLRFAAIGVLALLVAGTAALVVSRRGRAEITVRSGSSLVSSHRDLTTTTAFTPTSAVPVATPPSTSLAAAGGGRPTPPVAVAPSSVPRVKANVVTTIPPGVSEVTTIPPGVTVTTAPTLPSCLEGTPTTPIFLYGCVQSNGSIRPPYQGS